MFRNISASNRSYVTFCYVSQNLELFAVCVACGNCTRISYLQDNLNFDNASVRALVVVLRQTAMYALVLTILQASLGTHVNAGFNAGTGNVYYSLPGASTAADTTFACSGSFGCYTFRQVKWFRYVWVSTSYVFRQIRRVDGATIVPARPSPTQTQTASDSWSSSETASPSVSGTATGTEVATQSGSQSRSTSGTCSVSQSHISSSSTMTASLSASGTASEVLSSTPSQSASGFVVPIVAVATAPVDSSRLVVLLVVPIVALLVVCCCCAFMLCFLPGRRHRKRPNEVRGSPGEKSTGLFQALVERALAALSPPKPLSGEAQVAAVDPSQEPARGIAALANLTWSPLALARGEGARAAATNGAAMSTPAASSPRVAGGGSSSHRHLLRFLSGRTLVVPAAAPLSSVLPQTQSDAPLGSASPGEQLIGFRHQASGRMLLAPRTVSAARNDPASDVMAMPASGIDGSGTSASDAVTSGPIASVPRPPPAVNPPIPRFPSRRGSNRSLGRHLPRILPPESSVSRAGEVDGVVEGGGGVKIELVRTEAIVLRPVSVVKGDPAFASFSRQQREAAAAMAAAASPAAIDAGVPAAGPRAAKPRPARSAGATPRPSGAAAAAADGAAAPPAEKPRVGGVARLPPPLPVAPPPRPAFTAVVGRETVAVRAGPRTLRGVVTAVRLMAPPSGASLPLRSTSTTRAEVSNETTVTYGQNLLANV